MMMFREGVAISVGPVCENIAIRIRITHPLTRLPVPWGFGGYIAEEVGEEGVGTRTQVLMRFSKRAPGAREPSREPPLPRAHPTLCMPLARHQTRLLAEGEHDLLPALVAQRGVALGALRRRRRRHRVLRGVAREGGEGKRRRRRRRQTPKTASGKRPAAGKDMAQTHAAARHSKTLEISRRRASPPTPKP